MARTSYQTYLMYSEDGTSYSKLVDVKEIPDLGKAPDTVDITTLSDAQKRYLQDILDTGQLEFTANYDLDDYKKLAALAHTDYHYAVWFGATTANGIDTPTGDAGKFEFVGQLAVYVKGASVSSAVEMGIAIAPSTEITLPTSSN